MSQTDRLTSTTQIFFNPKNQVNCWNEDKGKTYCPVLSLFSDEYVTPHLFARVILNIIQQRKKMAIQNKPFRITVTKSFYHLF